MTPSQIFNAAKYAAIIGLAGYVFYQVQLLGKLKVENKGLKQDYAEAIAHNETLTNRLKASQQAARTQQREATQYRRQRDNFQRLMEDLPSNTPFRDCIGVAVPVSISERLHQNGNGLFVPD